MYDNLLGILEVTESPSQKEFRVVRKHRPHPLGYRGLWSVFVSSTVKKYQIAKVDDYQHGGLQKVPLSVQILQQAPRIGATACQTEMTTIEKSLLSNQTSELCQHHLNNFSKSLRIQWDNAVALSERCEAQRLSTGNNAWGIWNHGNQVNTALPALARQRQSLVVQSYIKEDSYSPHPRYHSAASGLALLSGKWDSRPNNRMRQLRFQTRAWLESKNGSIIEVQPGIPLSMISVLIEERTAYKFRLDSCDSTSPSPWF